MADYWLLKALFKSAPEPGCDPADSGIVERGLEVLVADAFADRLEANAVVDELGRVGAAQLVVERRGDAGPGDVGGPSVVG